MSLFAEVFFARTLDPELGGRRLENRLQSGDKIPEHHLRAWRIARDEVMANVMRWIRLVMANYNAYTGRVVREDRLLHVALPDEMWARLRNFLLSPLEAAVLDRQELGNNGVRAQTECRLLGEGVRGPVSHRPTSRSLPRRSICRK